MKLTISTKRVIRGLLLVVIFLALAGLLRNQVIFIGGVDGGPQYTLLQLFSIGDEANIPTWYQSVTLLVCSILLATIAAAKKRYGDRYAFHWSLLAVIFLFLSMDEEAKIHEAVGAVSAYLVEYIGYTPSGFIYRPYFWVVPGAIFALIVVLAYLKFVVSLPRRTRRLLLIAGIVFAGGAIGMEMLQAGLHYFSEGEDWWSKTVYPTPIPVITVYSVLNVAEEVLEMLGIVIFIHALLSYISSYVEEISIQFRLDK